MLKQSSWLETGYQNSLNQLDTSIRNKHGVKKRIDGKGDGWANEHRDHLAKEFYIQDVDCLFGAVAFGHNTAERLFLEYAPDNYDNHQKTIREFGIVALFDRKKTKNEAFSKRTTVSRGLYLWLCRKLRDVQGIGPKFFYVIGDDKPPWEMIELNIDTGETNLPTITLHSEEWTTIWQQLGLLELRQEITKRLL